MSIPAPGGMLSGGGVTLLHAGETAGTEIPLAAFVPGSASADMAVADRDTTTADAECYLPAGTQVLLTDRIIYQGITYQVAGMPQTWTSPWTGMQGPVRVQLRL